MNNPCLLIAEDDSGFRDTLKIEFEDRGFAVTAITSYSEFSRLPTLDFDYAVIDLKLGTDNGLKLVDTLAKSRHNCRIVILTGYGSIATAVQATKLGAHNYLTKPASVGLILAALQVEAPVDTWSEPQSEPFSLARAEREYIETIIATCDGNISRAATRLGVHRQLSLIHI